MATEVVHLWNIFQPRVSVQKHPNNIITQLAIIIFHIRLTWIIWHLITPAFHIAPDIPSNISRAKQYEATGHKSQIYWCVTPAWSDFSLISCHFHLFLASAVYATPSLLRLLNLFNYLYYHKVICLYSYTQFHIFAITINHEARRKRTPCQPLNHLNN